MIFAVKIYRILLPFSYQEKVGDAPTGVGRGMSFLGQFNKLPALMLTFEKEG
jgi:hypothetical protein